MKRLSSSIYSILLLFGFLGVLFIPFSFRNLNFQAEITRFIFEDSILFLASLFEGISITNPAISSDSTSMYLLVLILLFIAIIFSLLLPIFRFWKKHKNKTLTILQLILVYYLALIMLKYGFDKVFKAQFYLPEPNLLFTPLGKLDKDILYWSTMGSSYSYNIFMGLMEVIPALLLLFKKTRILGLFILSGVLINVVFVNFSFDISVKLFSSFLLFINLLLLAPSIKKIIQFFVLNKLTALPYLAGSEIIASQTIRLSIKGFAILFIFMETLLPTVQSGNYNDDTVPRNPLHGAYEISKSESKGLPENFNIKRFFIHRQNYFIFQHEDDSMEDFSLEIKQNELILTDYEGDKITLDYKYSEDSKSLEIKSDVFGWTIYGKENPWRELPLMQPLFHWNVDGINEKL